MGIDHLVTLRIERKELRAACWRQGLWSDMAAIVVRAVVRAVEHCAFTALDIELCADRRVHPERRWPGVSRAVLGLRRAEMYGKQSRRKGRERGARKQPEEIAWSRQPHVTYLGDVDRADLVRCEHFIDASQRHVLTECDIVRSALEKRKREE